jgi:hypothetical protein
MRAATPLLLLALAMVGSIGSIGSIGCGDDDAPYTIIGAPCRGELDCAPGVFCETGGDFPDGTCALPCRGHFDCPSNTACVDVKGGVCLPRCNNTLQCRPRYECDDRKNRDGAGASLVCIH